MPEPGINDPDFDFPTEHGKRRRGAGIGRRLKLPGGFAGFRLTDGRALGEVMGPEAFDEAAANIPEGDDGAIRDCVYPMAGEQENHPEHFAPPPPEPRSMDSSKSVLFPVPKPRPVGIGDAGTGRGAASGPRFFDLPLAADGRVDEKALLPRGVYRMPDSAGGGLGRWTNGMFYNYDRKADWNIRSPADLDAYSGATEAPTPEERAAELENWLMPARRLDDGGIAAFSRKSGYGLLRPG